MSAGFITVMLMIIIPWLLAFRISYLHKLIDKQERKHKLK